MRQLVSESAINEGAKHRCCYHNENAPEAGSNEGEHGTRTSASQSPPQTKYGAANQVTSDAFVFWKKLDLFAKKRLDFKAFHRLHHDHTKRQCTTDDAIHVKGFELEHFIDSEPRSRFRLVHRDAKNDSYKEVKNAAHD